MHFVIHCTDKADSAHIRTETRSEHVEYLKSQRDNLYIAGPTMSDDCEGMTGSLLIVDFPDRDAAEAFAAADPYAKAGLFESVTIQPWKFVFAPHL